MRALLSACLFLLPAASFAEHRVVAVVPPPEAARAHGAVELEILLAASAETTIISRGAQLEILRGLGVKKDVAVDDALALRLGRLSGCDGVVHGAAGAWRLCRPAAGTCAPLAAPAAGAAAALVLRELGAAPPPAVATATESRASPAALAAWVSCRSAVSHAVEQAAVKGRRTSTKGIDADCRKAATGDPANRAAKIALAAARALQGDGRVEAELREAAEAKPADALAAAALYHLLVTKERDTEALAVLARAKEKAPASLDLRRLHAERLFGMDMFDDALPHFQAALRIAPRSPYLHWRVSCTLHMKGDDAAALDHAEQASRFSAGEHPFYQEEYASRLIDNGRYEQALAVLEPLRKADPAWGRLALRMGFALHRLGRSREALPLFEEAAKAAPRDRREKADRHLAELDIARACAVLGEADRAFAVLARLRDADRLDPFMLKDADFDAIREDPRFAALTR